MFVPMRNVLSLVFGNDETRDKNLVHQQLSQLGILHDNDPPVTAEMVEDVLDDLIRIWKDCVYTDSNEIESLDELKSQVFEAIAAGTYWSFITAQIHGILTGEETLSDNNNIDDKFERNQSATITLSGLLGLDIPTSDAGVPRSDTLAKIYDRIILLQTEESEQEEAHVVDDIDPDGALEISTPLLGRPDLTWTVGKLLEGINVGEIDFPLWQRKGDAWSLTKKRNLIRSMLVGIPLPTMIMHRRNDGVMEVIDGRQRLTALQLYMDGKFKTASFKDDFQPMTAATATPPGFNLRAYSGKKYADIENMEITDANGTLRTIGRHIEQAPVPLLIFDNLTSQQLYFIFTVYNTNSTPLNDAEIRNAVYHEHPLHKMMMDLSGDAEADAVIDPEFTRDFRRLLSPKDGQPTRFKAVSFLARYAAYTIPSGQFRDNGRLVKDSNKKHIHYLMESSWDWKEKDLKGLAVEISNAFKLCTTIHIDTGYQPYHTQTAAGRDTFNGVKAIASLSAAGIMIAAQEKYKLTADQLKSVIIAFEETVEFPEKQYAGPTWGYHLGVVEVTRQKLVEMKANPVGLRGGRFDKLLTEAKEHFIEQALLAKEANE